MYWARGSQNCSNYSRYIVVFILRTHSKTGNIRRCVRTNDNSRYLAVEDRIKQDRIIMDDIFLWMQWWYLCLILLVLLFYCVAAKVESLQFHDYVLSCNISWWSRVQPWMFFPRPVLGGGFRIYKRSMMPFLIWLKYGVKGMLMKHPTPWVSQDGRIRLPGRK